MKLVIDSINQMEECAKEFIQNVLPEYRIFAFYGAMGAGKTTFIKSVCQALGVTDTITSPTFSIINEYSSNQLDYPIYHFDFYRIKKLEEAYDMGYEEYFYSNAICFIEWPELVEELLPENTLKITIEEQADGKRIITW
ncbi:MAG: tRNA (adenosine(37)-N6)-threonylcarbamoyltransferase complex ATPase subunit type 1 TsaE [Bacteroidales bacterium]|nr:tRNA (adenosine(37)-N6)-threonylcarbamoyltransferase complex ATPase subunit type 1 TsaE [Bacteroidales bacterium]